MGKLYWTDDYEHAVLAYTEEEILAEYWDEWKAKMEKKYGSDHPDITPENCIEDWTVENWAWTTDE